MKKNIALFLLLIGYQQMISQECAYEDYYLLTDLARKEFKTQNYKSAKDHFEQAFSKKVFPLGHDLSFAFFTAIELKDNAWTLSIAEKLAKGGIPLRYFSKFKKHGWYKRLEPEYGNYTIFYKENFDPIMRDKYLQLLREDKEFNSQYHEFRERKIDLSLSQLIDGATKIKMDFEAFYNEFGFPNEQKMGYNYVRHLNRITPYSTNALIIHIYQRGVRVFEKDIHHFVCNGGLKPIDEEILKKVNGFGNNTGIDQEMKIRFDRIYNKD